jgi:L-amino acid N-acyltransferase YncA
MNGCGSSVLGRVSAAAVAGLRSLGAVRWEEMCVYASALEAFEPVDAAPDDVRVAVDLVEDARALPTETAGAEPSDLVATASADGVVVGWAFARADPPLRVGECVRLLVFEGAYVWGLFVESPARGRGVGATLVSALTDAVARDRYGSAFALVESSNARSRRVFERVGYRCVDETLRVAVGGRRPPTGALLGARTYTDADS